MIKQLPALVQEEFPYKNVQHCLKSAHTESKQQVLLEILKTLEQQMLQRGIVTLDENLSFYPIWFLAETTRNIFLWRHGLSVGAADRFEFWIDVESLLEKRQEHLSRFDEENPFLNSLWGSAPANPATRDREFEYLELFSGHFETIQAHAHALSLVGSELMEEAVGAVGLERVVLPEASTPSLS
jgi:hypothetical protein